MFKYRQLSNSAFITQNYSITTITGITGVRQVRSLGDTNGDGVDDLAISSVASNDAGNLCIIYGRREQFPNTIFAQELTLNQGYYIIDNYIRTSGTNIGYIGDINGDGLNDIVGGNINWNIASPYGFVYFGTTNQNQLHKYTNALNGNNGFVITGGPAIGCSFNNQPGDFNGDGYNDILTGGPIDNANGVLYVGYGSNHFTSSLNVININGLTITQPIVHNYFGCNSISAGDVNGDGDGVSDIIVSDAFFLNNIGAVYVVFGQRNFPASISVANLNGNNGFTIIGISSEYNIGNTVSGIGDLNGDGFDDIAIGAPGAAGNAGQIYVLYGANGSFPSTISVCALNGQNGFIIQGMNNGDNAGLDISFIGSFNGDNITDLAIGAPGINNGNGCIYVLFGSNAGFPVLFSLSDINGQNGINVTSDMMVGKNFGKSVGGGDFNNDGLTDLLISDNNNAHIVFNARQVPFLSPTSTRTPTPSPTINPTVDNLITDYEYAALSLHVYRENEIHKPVNWKTYLSYEKPEYCIWVNKPFIPECSYYATAYIKNNKEIVISHRGSQDPAKNFNNWYENLVKLMNGKLSEYYALALTFTHHVQKKIEQSQPNNVIIGHTGHSLGGHIAELMSAKFGIKAVTFDSPGSLTVIKNYPAIFTTPVSNLKTLITTYNAAPHLINTMDYHPGTLYRVYPPYYDVYLAFKINFDSFSLFPFSLQQHKMKGIYDQFIKNTGTTKVIGNGYNIWEDDGVTVVGTDNAQLLVICNALINLLLNLRVDLPLCNGGALVLRNMILNREFYDKYDVNPYYWEQRFDDEDVTSDYRVAKIDGSVLYVEYSLGGITSHYNKAGMIITGDNNGNHIWGTTNYADTINSGFGNDEIWTFSGNDVVTDSGGYDIYHFYLHNMKGRHIINDSDGKGKIYLENIFCNLAGKITIDSKNHGQYKFKPKDNKNCDIDELSGWWGYKHKSDIFLLRLVNNNKDLQITYNAANKKNFPYSKENTIYITDFSQGDFDINLPNKYDRVLQLEDEEDIIGSNDNETLSCSLAENSEVYGLIGFDTYIFYIGNKYNCSLMGNIFNPKIFKAEAVSEDQDGLGIIEIIGFKPGDLLDLSALNISDFYDIGYDVENYTTYFTLPNDQQIVLDSSPRDISISLNESVIFNSIDSGRVAVPKDDGYLFLMDEKGDFYECNDTCNITTESNSEDRLYNITIGTSFEDGLHTTNSATNSGYGLSTTSWVGITISSFIVGLFIPYIIKCAGCCNRSGYELPSDKDTDV